MSYVVKEIFSTIQGEGARAGTKAVFLRTSGCNAWSGREDGRERGAGACAAWCDTDFVDGTMMGAAEIVYRLDELWPRDTRPEHEGRWVVITGGEPALQLDWTLVTALRDGGWLVAVETNGTLDPTFKLGDSAPLSLLDYVSHLCVSPKLGTTLKRLSADELKVVVPGIKAGDRRHHLRLKSNQSPYCGGPNGWTFDALDALLEAGDWGDRFVQPQDDPDPRIKALNVELAIAIVRHDPRWRLSVQMHKMLGLA